MPNKIAFTAAGFLAGIAITIAVLGPGARTAGADQTDNAYMVAQKASVAQATYQLDSAGLHGIDDAVKAGTVPAGALGNVRRARIAVQSAEWPEALKEMASKQVETMKSLEEVLRSEDAAKVSPLAAKAHDDGHDLSAAVYTWLDTGMAPSGGGHGH